MIVKGQQGPFYDECEYCERVYYESDTGYAEYGCTIGNNNPEQHSCYEDLCPLMCKWIVEE